MLATVLCPSTPAVYQFVSKAAVVCFARLGCVVCTSLFVCFARLGCVVCTSLFVCFARLDCTVICEHEHPQGTGASPSVTLWCTSCILSGVHIICVACTVTVALRTAQHVVRTCGIMDLPTVCAFEGRCVTACFRLLACHSAGDKWHAGGFLL
jgi:hypothetical protein